MTGDNVRIPGPDITHAKARSERQITRCGIEYVRNGQYVIGDMSRRPMGHKTDADVDCMTCLVKDEWHNADISEILAKAVKDMQEYARALDFLEGREPSK